MKHTPAARAWVIAGIFGLAAAGTAGTAGALTVSGGDSFTFFFDETIADGSVSGEIDITVVDTGVGTFDLITKLSNTTDPSLASDTFGKIDTIAFDFVPDPATGGVSVTNPLAGDFTDDVDDLHWAFDAGQFPGGTTSDTCVNSFGGPANNMQCASAEVGLLEGFMDRWTLHLLFGDGITDVDEFDIAGIWARFSSAGDDQEGSFVVQGVIPIPATLPLFLTGLLGFGFLARRRRQTAEA